MVGVATCPLMEVLIDAQWLLVLVVVRSWEVVAFRGKILLATNGSQLGA